MDFISLIKDKYHIALNEQQIQAVEHNSGPALVLAGPGSGKTLVIAARTARLILSEKVDPEKILTVTYNKAAQIEMQNRFRRLFGESAGRKARFSTFHSFCYSVLHDYEKRQGRRFRLIEGNSGGMESKPLILKNIHRNINQTNLNDDELEILMNEIGFVKNRMLGEEDYSRAGLQSRRFGEIYRAYENYKKTDALIDFDDMLVYALWILNRRPDMLAAYRDMFLYYQIDEAQDLSKLQFEILKLLVPAEKNNLFLVADDDQSIYGFRGAEPGYIFDLADRYPGMEFFRLENNYRSSRNIVELSSRFIKTNTKRYEKNHSTLNDYRMPPLIINVKDRVDELKWLEENIRDLRRRNGDASIAVLYRNNLSSVPLADYFDRVGIPYDLRQGRVFLLQHWLVQDIIAFFRFASDPSDRESFQRIYYKMNRYISKGMLEEALGDARKQVLDSIASSPSLSGFQRKKMLDLKQELKKFSRMKPPKALDYIEEEFKYFGSVRDYCDKTGQSFEYVYSLFGILKTLANWTGTIPLFLERIAELERILEPPAQPAEFHRVRLSTLHASKGLEFDAVFMVDLNQDEIPGQKALSRSKSGDGSMIEEERRLFYVGMTRARQLLYLVAPEGNGGTVARSIFVSEVAGILNGDAPGRIREGTVLNHKKYGKGIVTGIEQKTGKPVLISVDFHGKTRTLDLATCLEYGIITL